MPLIKLHTPVSMDHAQQEALMGALSKIVTEKTSKPESVVMVTLEQGPVMLAATAEDAALLDVRGIGGLTKEVNTAITVAVCELLQTECGIPPERVYVTFTDVPGENWGWNGKTFR